MDYKPPLPAMLHDTVDSVEWLRSQMTATIKPGEDEDQVSTGHAFGSKPPFRVAYMDAADREAAVLGRWMDSQALTIAYPVYRVQGVVTGLLGGDTRVVRYMADKLSAWLTCMDPYSVRALEDELWSVRSQHFANWPQLAAFLTPVPAGSVPPVEEPGLF